MSRPIAFALPGSEALLQALCGALGAEMGSLEHRQFPDGETYLRIVSDAADRDVVLLCSLDRPDAKLLPLLFAADTLRELGARKVGLVAPYLAYMRQDVRFHPGEAVTSRTFAALLSRHLDWMVTVDPHLHRYHALSEIYRIPTQIVHAAPLVASWIKQNVARPLIIGPDMESEQWVAQVAADADTPFLVCEKVRSGDREVTISIPHASAYPDRQPVLVDDIASSGRTLAVAARQLIGMGFAPPDCAVVHPLFAGDAAQVLGALVGRIVSTNTIAHATNEIDVVPTIVEAVHILL
ncbi:MULTISPECIES: ribose-phosphate pyrophosphokinase [Sphingobium]|uniref:Phosphoribosylpyrophosphate synthetase n=1 Tax=Sphingobium baderi LL03 TaxID=1114964 RepID=T0I395_9SPHN|nr:MULTISPECIES: ribose-phosphate diphosphokinase [Sphingobium]EQB04114.1 phosphoribosylpyrophosphate synthetase [Sphingobium baderi LL03]KMS63097.1 phosphoribosylpyrophosphate synthetase [Sphingobium baderi LL03]MDX3911353.1 ribose-phosphate pyrophosphokinase [Sphingobium sp.]